MFPTKLDRNEFWFVVEEKREIARLSRIASKRLAHLLQLIPKNTLEINEERATFVARYNALQRKHNETYYYEYDAVDEYGEPIKKRFYQTVKDVPLGLSLNQVREWLNDAKREILLELACSKTGGDMYA